MIIGDLHFVILVIHVHHAMHELTHLVQIIHLLQDEGDTPGLLLHLLFT